MENILQPASHKVGLKTRGVLLGIAASLLGSLVFGLGEMLVWSFRVGDLEFELAGIAAVISLGLSILPAGVGALILAISLRRMARQGVLTRRKASQAGALAAGLSAFLICVLVILVLSPWVIGPTEDVARSFRAGYYYTALVQFIPSFFETLIVVLPEVILALLVACPSGAVIAHLLAKFLLQPSPSQPH